MTSIIFLPLSKFVRIVLAMRIDLSSTGGKAKVSGDFREIVQHDSTNTGFVARHVGIGITASFCVSDGSGIHFLTGPETFGVQIDVLHVFRTKRIFHIHAVQGAVAPGGFGIVGIHANGTIGIIKSCPHGANHEIRVFETVGLDPIGPALIHFTCTKRTDKTYRG